jgi:hypothetical protein
MLNPLWLSMQKISYAELVNKLFAFVDSLESKKNVFKSFTDFPFYSSLIYFGALPVLFSVIAVLLCYPFFCCNVQCNPYRKYILRRK